MTKILRLDLMREIRHSLNRFLSILCIVAIGVAFFAGLKSASPDMAYTMDAYFDQAELMDIQLVSTLGLTQGDVEAIAQVEGVETVQAGYFVDMITTVDAAQLVTRIHSLPDSYYSDGTDCINRLALVEGRLPEAYDEIVVETSKTRDLGVRVGDRLTFETGSAAAQENGGLRTTEFTVVGLVKTPYYLTFDKGTSQLGGKALDMFAYTMESTFSLDYYVEALVTVKGAKQLNTFSARYTDTVAEVSAALQNLGTDRAAVRADELRAQATEQLNAAQTEYDEKKAEFDEQIVAARAALQDAFAEIIRGEAKLQSEKEKYELQVKFSEQQIAEGQAQLYSSSAQIDAAQQQLNTTAAALSSAQQQYDAAMAQNEQYIEMLSELEVSLAALIQSMDELNAQIDGLTDSIEDAALKAQLETLLIQYQQFYEQAKKNYELIKAASEEIGALVQITGDALAQANAQMSSAQAQLDSARGQYAEGQGKVDNARAQLLAGQASARREFTLAEQKLAGGRKEYEENSQKLDEEERKGSTQLAQAQLQLIYAESDIERIENAQWYVLDREMNYGFVSYKSTVDRMSALAQLLPLFFILVAVLVCMTTMTRMVNEQRGIIGVYKALGYSDKAVILKYVAYVTIASTVGGVLGAVLGTKLFPPAVYNAWQAMYQQPEFSGQLHPVILVVSFLLTVAAMALTAYYTCRAELRTVPAQLMRPKAPRAGKTIFLEKMPWLWSSLNFSQKVTARNIFRYKKRLCMTVIGIMGCTSLLLASFGMNDTIGLVVKNQYEGIFRYDVTISATEEASAEVESVLAQNEAVQSFTQIGLTSATLSNGSKSETASVYVTDSPSTLGNYISLRNRQTKNKISLDDTGVVLSEKLAEQLGVGENDMIEMTNADNITKSIRVSAITENYVYHYAYLTQEAYRNYFWSELPQTGTLVCLSDRCTSEQQTELLDTLSAQEGVGSVVSFTEVAENFTEQIRALSSIIVLIIACAAALAFVVLYNLTNVNISERIREIATIKVLGFKNGEVAMYVYRENFILTLMGALCGLLGGVGLHRFIMKSIEQSNVMFGYTILPLSFAWALLLTLAFSVLVMLYMYRGLMRISMVESLKSIE